MTETSTQTRIDLTEEQRQLLTEMLRTTVSDLGMEIAATERQSFRDQLKHRRELVQAMLHKLETPREAAA